MQGEPHSSDKFSDKNELMDPKTLEGQRKRSAKGKREAACAKPSKKRRRSRRSKSCKSRSRSRSRRSRRRRSRKGKQRISNPQISAFFKFLRMLQRRHCNWDAVKLAVEGAKGWCKLSADQRRRFITKRKRKCGTRKRSRSAKGCKPKRRRHRKKKC